MSLSNGQKAQVVYFLGWAGKTIVEGSTHYNSQVVDRLKNLTTEIEQQTQGLLTEIAALDEKLKAAQCRTSAKEVDGIVLNENEITQLRGERKRLIKDLSLLLDIPVARPGGVMFGVCV